MGKQYVIPFVGVIYKIVDSRHRVLTQHTIPPGLLLKMNFPIAPFQTEDVVAHVDYKAVASRFLALSQEEIGYVRSVNNAIFRDLSCILSTASGSRLRCNPDGLCERGHFKGAAEAVAEIGEGAYAQLLRCLHQRCEDVHRTDASLAPTV